MDGIYTTGQVAKIFNVAPRTVAKWCDRGSLKHYRIPGSQDRRISREQLERFAKEFNMPLPSEETTASQAGDASASSASPPAGQSAPASASSVAR